MSQETPVLLLLFNLHNNFRMIVDNKFITLIIFINHNVRCLIIPSIISYQLIIESGVIFTFENSY